MIKFNNLNKYYNKGKKNEIHVLKNISYEFPDKGLITFLGESGSGKTTLLNLLGGLLYSEDTIYYDDVEFNNKNIDKLDNYRNKNIGFIFQNYLLLKDETVYDNLKLALEVCNIFDEEEQEKRIVEVLKALKIYKYRKKIAGKLSGGEQQRVSIARALVKGAKVLLCDEPTGNLDKKNSIKVMDILKSISQNALVILVTHNKDLARFYSDRIINMVDGEIASETNKESFSLDITYSDTIYLGELDNKKIDNNNFKIDYYSDNSKDVNLRVILKNGHLFIESNVETNLFNKDSLDVREGIREDVKNENLEYNLTFADFKDKYDKDYSFSNLFFKSFKNKKKKLKNKILGFISFTLGLIIALFSFFGIGTFYSTKEDSYYNEGYYVLESERQYIGDDILNMFDKGYIDNIFIPGFRKTYFNIPGFADKNYRLPNEFQYLRYDNEQLLYGRKPDENGVVISEYISYLLCEEYDVKPEELIDQTIKCDNISLNINGISKNGTGIYFDKKVTTKFNDKKIWNLIDINDKDKYQIIEVEDEDSEKNGAYVEKSTGLNIGNYINGVCRVNGFIEEIPEVDNVVVTSKNNFRLINNLDTYSYLDSNVKISKGRKIEKWNEIIIPENYGQIGDEYKSLVVVGLYNNPIDETKCQVYASDFVVDAYINNYPHMPGFLTHYSRFKIKDNEEFKKYMDSLEYEDISLLTLKEETERNRFNDNQIGFMIIASLILVVTIIYIYFMKRSEIIVDHYDITVLRSMGATKKYIYKRYLASNLVDSIKTITFGLILGFVIYYIAAQRMENIILELSNIVLLTVFMLFSYFLLSLIPLHSILKKEPAYLTAKYDI